MTAFIDQLETARQQRGNPVLVGLDPRAEMLPPRTVARTGRAIA